MVDYKKIVAGLAVISALSYGALNIKGCYNKDQDAARQEQARIEAARKTEESKIPDRYLTIVNATQKGKVGHSVNESYSSTGEHLGYTVQFEAFDESEQNPNTHGVDNNRIDNGEKVYMFRIKIGNEEDLEDFLGRAKDGWRVKYKGSEKSVLPVEVTNIITGNYEDLDFDKPLGFSYEGTDSKHERAQDSRMDALEKGLSENSARDSGITSSVASLTKELSGLKGRPVGISESDSRKMAEEEARKEVQRYDAMENKRGHKHGRWGK